MEMGEKPKRTPSLKEAFIATKITHRKIMAT
jgi:hypothetical protein